MSLEGKTKNWEFSKIDFYFFIGLVITTIGYAHFNSILVPVDEELDFFEILEAVQYWAIGIVAFFFARRFDWKLEIFSKTYISLALGYLLSGVGMIFYYYNEMFVQEELHLTIAQVFFTIYYPFMIYHLHQNCKYFKKNFGVVSKILLVSFPLVISFIYCYFLLEQSGFIDIKGMISLPLVITNSLSMAYAIIAIFIFRKTFLGVAWLFLSLSILIISVGDIWFQVLNLFDLYQRDNPVQIFYFVSNMLMLYALYKHNKII
ncbi:MAG: hypothetical protein PVH93_08805 [Nitrosopumilaceae archaeon]